jgi:DNA-binding XRE family transcriptional regulator
LTSSPRQGTSLDSQTYGRIYETIRRLMAEPRDKLMQSTALDSLPPKLRRSLAKLGGDIAAARRKRSLTAVMMAERIGSAKSTYLKVEKGDPTVSMGVYAMALFVLGFGDAVGDIVDPRRDDVGLLLDAERLPKRVRPRKMPTAL